MLRIKYITIILFSFLLSSSVLAQESGNTSSLTKEKILSMTTEELSTLSLEELMAAIDLVGVSSLEELYELLLNKNVTSASKAEESLFDSPLSSTVLSHDQIISSGATSIEEALRLVPGLIVREKTNGNYDVHIRGNDNLPAKNMLLYSENMNTLVMINGRPVFNYSHGGTLWETLPVSFEDIDRIEVVRGPASALYGPNALAGVINIITQTITDDSPVLSGNLQAGSLSTYVGDVAFRKKVSDKFNVGLTANYEVRDREREELYIYNGEDENGNGIYRIGKDPVTNPENMLGTGWYTKEQIGQMWKGDYQLWPPYMVGAEEYNVNTSFPDPDQSKERMGLNAYFDFMPNEHTTINLMAGYQNSQALTSSMGDVPSPFSTKQASTGYVDLRAKVKNFSLQANYNGGTIDYMSGNEGFELDNKQFNVQAEYDWNLGKIGIRPGVSFQSMAYDDSEHISTIGKGYLNQESSINILAGSARIDYRPIDNLRLVAALRAEKYNHPDDIYTSWQFIGSYKLNDNNLIRAVYSRSNQSSFLVNTYSNYTWNIVNRPYPRVMQFDGDKNHDLKTMDMVEIGFRTRPTKSLLIDIEAFYNVSEGFGALMPDYANLAIKNPLAILTAGAAPDVRPDSVHIQYTNLELKSKQLGASVNVDWVISEKLVANAHLTVQQTKLDNYLAYSRDELIAHMAGGAALNTDQTDAATAKLQQLGYGLATGAITPADVPSQIFYAESSSWPTDTKNDYEYKSTPSYFGGFSLTYRPTDKWEIFPQAYFYGEQMFENQYYDVDIDSKFLLNAKVAYKATKQLTFFVNGRNILNMKEQEFAFMDQTPGMVLGGVSFKF